MVGELTLTLIPVVFLSETPDLELKTDRLLEVGLAGGSNRLSSAAC